jgi:hypothetical protein
MSSISEPESHDRDFVEIGAWISIAAGLLLLPAALSRTSSADCMVLAVKTTRLITMSMRRDGPRAME